MKMEYLTHIVKERVDVDGERNVERGPEQRSLASGGFYKYRCKYFYSRNCTNWVYVNGAPCAMCVADGRELNRQQEYPMYTDGFHRQS
ncbi:hypothetical protein B0T16DRAFT_413188 [Cercophora newfieldiana]|uniref:Uncharacterized protein n=1 Tax=Cercophora newfieldiana TaxID=92897 RepID=A0AA40CPY3_9PEZI|nr:hypothetical protein B0T16DRAFT_413188 [Cercophora newfieldiana]